MKQINLTRRRFLWGVFGILIYGYLQPFCCLTLTNYLMKFYTHSTSASIIGLAYLKTKPSEANAKKLVKLLSLTKIESWENLVILNPTKLRQSLLHQIQTDFKQGRIIRLEHWVLSLTEVRLCALAALA